MQSQTAIPILKPDEAMFNAAMQHSNRIGLLATFAPAVSAAQLAFSTQAQQQGRAIELQTICVPEAMEAARNGDIATHNRLVAAALPQLANCDAIMLAHFSTATALDISRAATIQPILSSPESAVLSLKHRLLT